ncbi:MAG: hypothetical protein KGH89_05390 [Thaumarchaeota archaeon]|nr:hypothetical protein [Nitrososphaerota archaeon]MDE1866241.1 hypothetical protein [Nitrososphaerota archaeon]
MSSSNEPSDSSKPVLRDKNPHNYRKVGYSMIVISVSLVAIGLLVWAIGSDYHFSTNIMASQEVDAMTPKTGYNVVLFDISQPVGAKLKLLDHADALDAAQVLQSQDAQQNQGSTMQVLLFNATNNYNLNLMANAEVFVQTPKQCYNVILFNDDLPVGQKLTLGIHENAFENATAYQKQQVDSLQGQGIQVLIFTPSFTDDLKMVTGSSTPVGAYAVLASNETSPASFCPALQPANQTKTVTTNQTAVVPTNNTMISNKTTTVVANQTAVMATSPIAKMMISHQTNSTTPKTMNTTTNVSINATVSAGAGKSVTLNETMSVNATGK